MTDPAESVAPGPGVKEALELQRMMWASQEPKLIYVYERDWLRVQAENKRMREALTQARDCCARPAGVCFDPALIDG